MPLKMPVKMKMFKSVKRKINLTHFLIANPVLTNNALSSQAVSVDVARVTGIVNGFCGPKDTPACAPNPI